MKEFSIPVNFTVEKLEKPLRQKKVTATIRGKTYIQRFQLRPGKKIEVKYNRERIGFAVIKSIKQISYVNLFDTEIIRKEGFESAADLIFALKPFWRYHWNQIIAGKVKMPLIEFQWL